MLLLFWELWPFSVSYGRKGSQFVDLLGYFSVQLISTSSTTKDQVIYYENITLNINNTEIVNVSVGISLKVYFFGY